MPTTTQIANLTTNNGYAVTIREILGSVTVQVPATSMVHLHGVIDTDGVLTMDAGASDYLTDLDVEMIERLILAAWFRA